MKSAVVQSQPGTLFPKLKALQGPVVRTTKLTSQLMKTGAHKTYDWFCHEYPKHVNRLEKPALVLGVLSGAELTHILHALTHLNIPQVCSGVAVFIGSKYAYMGVKYYQEIQQILNCPHLRETLTQAIRHISMESKEYVRHNANNGIQAFVEGQGAVRMKARWLRQLIVYGVQHPRETYRQVLDVAEDIVHRINYSSIPSATRHTRIRKKIKQITEEFKTIVPELVQDSLENIKKR